MVDNARGWISLLAKTVLQIWCVTAAARQVLCAPDNKLSNSLLRIRSTKQVPLRLPTKQSAQSLGRTAAGRQQQAVGPLASDYAVAADAGHVARYN